MTVPEETTPPEKEEGGLTDKLSGMFQGIKRMTGKPEKGQTESAEGGSSALDKIYGQVRSLVGWRSAEDTAKLFKAWAAKTNKAPKFTAWLNELSLEDAAEFTSRIAELCENQHFKLNWLVDPEAKPLDDKLRAELTEVVYAYIIAEWKGNQLQEELQVFVTLQDWLEHPTHKKYKKLNSQIFSALVDEKVVTAPSMDLFMASDKERETHFVDAIKKVANEDRPRLNRLLKAELKASKEAEADSGPEQATDAVGDALKKE